MNYCVRSKKKVDTRRTMMNIVWNHHRQIVLICIFIVVNVISTSNVCHRKKIECHLDISSYGSYYDVITNEIQILHSIDLSIANLATDLTARLNKEDPSFFHIKTKVAPVLFEALTTPGFDSPRPVLVSFIGINGVFFSYFTGGEGGTFSVYSNDTLSSSSYTWYTQSVSSSEVGKLIGEVEIDDSPTAAMNTESFLLAVNMTNGYTSIGRRWCGKSEVETLVIRTVFFEQLNGAVSLGFPIEDKTDMISKRMFKGGNGEKTISAPIQKKSIISGDDNGDFIDERLVRLEDAQCLPIVNEIVDSASSLIDIWRSIKLKIAVKVSAYAYQPLVDTINKNIEGTSVYSIVMAVAYMTSGYFAHSIQIARKKRGSNAQLNKYKKAAQEAERRAMNKSAAVATVSHDVRAALACIISLIELSYSTVARGSEVEINLRQMNTCARDLLDLLNSILDASKLEAGKMQLEENKFDLSKLLEDVVDLYHPVGMKKGVDVVLDPCDGSLYKYPMVKGDSLKLKQVISNLLSNAVKFTTEGHISVRAWARRPMVQDSVMNGARRNTTSTSSTSFFFWKPKKTVDPDNDESKNMVKQDPNCVEYVFEVDDTGKGIPKDKQKAVFENYVQVKETDAAVGTGLGLGIVQSLVRLMGGDIEVVDKPSDQRGTCFRFNIFLTNCASHKNVFPSKVIPNQDSNAPHIDDGTNPMDAQSDHSVLARIVGSIITKASLVVLLIQNEGRREMIKRFLKSIDIMVAEVKEAKDLPSILKKQNYNDPDHAQSTISFVLLIIDASAGSFSELKDGVARSKKELSSKSYCSVIWLETRESKNPSSLRSGEGEDIIPLADYVTSKPLHGCRLFEVIRLLPEFCGQLILHSKDQETVNEIDKSEGKGPSSDKAMSLGGLSSSDPPLFGKKVLIVEDNKMLMLVATKILTKMGAIVEKCQNGQEAVELVSIGLANQLFDGLDALPYDFILMDCEMPVIDGFEATKLIREEESEYGHHIPIIALTAHENGEELQRTFEVGMDYNLQKPLEEEKLMIALEFIERQNMIMQAQE
ncbi:hypothetical protein V2J09_011342 [Rumex salicifolius]